MEEPRDSSISWPVRFKCAALAIAMLILGVGGLPAQKAASPAPPRGPYFGQSPPGTVPTVFAPGIVSLEDRYEYVIAFSPDGTECCFGVTDSKWSTCDLYCSRQEKGAWSLPVKAGFQQGPDGWLPFFAPDGKRLLFSSGRPNMQSANSYVCERTSEGWGPPRKLGPPVNSAAFDWRPTILTSGTLYFASNRGGGQENMDIYRSVPVDGEFREIEKLGPPVNSPHLEASPYLSPDESFLTFESWRPGGQGQGDLYISYRESDGSWTSPQNLGPIFNTEQIEDGGSISPDGKYYFFNRRKSWVTEQQTDIYWVDIRAVFRPYVQNPAGDAEAVVGKEFAMRLPDGEFADHDDAVLAYSATSAGGDPLPAWLAFDPETRTLRGMPRTAGEVAIDITATDPIGSTCSDPLRIRVSSEGVSTPASADEEISGGQLDRPRP